MTKKILIICSSALLLVLLIFTAVYQFEINAKANNLNQQIAFTVAKGSSVKTISENLYQSKLIRSKFFFKLYVWLNHKQPKLQAGDFELSSSQNLKELVVVLGSGKTGVVKLLIKEGETTIEISQIFADSGLGTTASFLAVTGQPIINNSLDNVSALPNLELWSRQYSFLADKPEGQSLEGYLFPDTYQLAKNAGPNQLVEKMLNNFDQKLTVGLRAEIARQGKSIFEVITMASLVEKEVRSSEDMKLVAGIFWQRLANRQALQSDATLSYVLNDKNAAHSAADLSLDSPYNSYMYRGLPPSPISNPGLKAIEAAINPTYSDYNFFLTSSIDGRTKFAETFEEHKRNKALFLK